MTEADLKRDLMSRLLKAQPGWILLAHQDIRRPGIPDLSLTGRGVTSWWEFKYGVPDFKSRGDQELMCLRLAAAGKCRYVVWLEDELTQRTLIVHPKWFQQIPHSNSYLDGRNLEPFAEETFAGFDHVSVVRYMERTHGKTA